MTSSLVNDVRSLFPGTDNRSEMGFGNVKNQNDSFTKIMDGYTSKNAENTAGSNGTVQQNVVNKVSDTSVKNKQVNSDAGSAKEKTNDSIKESQSKDAKKLDKDTSDKTVSKIEEKSNEIKDAIKDELGVSDEQIEAAMAILGLNMQDLLDADSVKDLMMNLAGAEDALVLLTDENLLNSINSVLEFVDESKNDIMSELGIDEEALKDIISDISKNEKDAQNDDSVIGMNNEQGVRDEKTSADNNLGKTRKITVEVNRTGDENQVQKNDNILRTGKTNESSEVFGQNEQNNQQNLGQGTTQTIVTTEVNNLGEIVETIRSYAGEYSSASEIMNQVTEHVRVNLTSESTSMEMQLHPASLGTVNLQIASQNGVVTAQLTVQNETVRAAMAEQMEQLQKTFEEQGQKVENIEVTVANYDLNHSLNQENGNETGEGSNGRKSRRAINLNDITDEMIDQMDEEEKLQAAVMDMNGTSVDYTA